MWMLFCCQIYNLIPQVGDKQQFTTVFDKSQVITWKSLWSVRCTAIKNLP